MDRENSRTVVDRMRRTFPRLVINQPAERHAMYSDPGPSNYASGSGRRLALLNASNPPEYIEVDPDMPLLYPDEAGEICLKFSSQFLSFIYILRFIFILSCA